MKTHTHYTISLLELLLVCVISVVVAGCATRTTPTAESIEGTTESSSLSEELHAAPGAQLWAQNCIRCHNYRTPASLSDRKWQLVLHHMRVRANLTAEEHSAILSFLQAAN